MLILTFSEILETAKLSGIIAGAGLASLLGVIACGFAVVGVYKKLVRPLVTLAQRAHLRRAEVI